jgi:hypothetical protein
MGGFAMKQAFAVAPGAIWCAVILGLTLGAIWLNDYMGGVVPAWLPPLILTVLVPILKVFAGAQPESPVTREVAPPARSKFNRWLW